MVIEVLEGIHYAALEAISLRTKAGIHPRIVLYIISNATGNSWIFKNYVPQWLNGIHTKDSFLNTFVQNLGTVTDVAKSLTFPLPLFAVSYQQLILDAENAEIYYPEQLTKQVSSKLKTVSRIGFIGLGAMGFGMATHLLKSNFSVAGSDVYEPSLNRFENAGGFVGRTPAEVAKDVDVLLIMVTNETQAESVLYGEFGAVSGKGLQLIDAPVSGGFKRASEGTLTIMASGSDEALHSTGSVLSALSEKLYIIRGGCGAGRCVKMINQLLARIHIASSAEAMAVGARLGLNTRTLFEVIIKSSGTSWRVESLVEQFSKKSKCFFIDQLQGLEF